MSLATAERFAKEGFRIALSARNAAKVRALVDELAAKGYVADARTVDAGDPESVAFLVAEAAERFGGVDVLHYNAASMRDANILAQPRETFNQDLAVNIGGALAAVQAVIPDMSERGAGTILLTGGGYALRPDPDHLSLSIFESLAGRGVHIATVTVSAAVVPGSKGVDAVAEHFWTLHSQPRGEWAAEVRYLDIGH
jgi:NAD(P)-dependent dehydrogenase (short-subunit alcohol dehydrogenase family)